MSEEARDYTVVIHANYRAHDEEQARIYAQDELRYGWAIVEVVDLTEWEQKLDARIKPVETTWLIIELDNKILPEQAERLEEHLKKCVEAFGGLKGRIEDTVTGNTTTFGDKYDSKT